MQMRINGCALGADANPVGAHWVQMRIQWVRIGCNLGLSNVINGCALGVDANPAGGHWVRMQIQLVRMECNSLSD